MNNAPPLESPSSTQIIWSCAAIALIITAMIAHTQPAAVENTAIVGVVTPKVEVAPAATSGGVTKASAKTSPDPKKPWTLILDGDNLRVIEKMKALAAAVIEGRSGAFSHPVVRVKISGNYHQAHVEVPESESEEEFIIRVDVDEKEQPYRFSISSGRKGTGLSERLVVSDTGMLGLSVEGRVPEVMTSKGGPPLDVPVMLKRYMRSCVSACHAVVAAADEKVDKKRQ